jgi:UDP-glucose 4-epimerase
LKIVVTGGAGFIGASVCRNLAAQAVVTKVIALDDLSTGDRRSIEDVPGVQLMCGSVLDDQVLHRALAGASSVVHLAARASVIASTSDPLAVHEINASGTLRVLEACRQLQIPHLVLASSAAVYGSGPIIPTPESILPVPQSPYAASKLAAEAYALAYARAYGIDVLPLRFFNVFGPGQDSSHGYSPVIPAFISAAIAGRPLKIWGDGTQSRDFIFVESVSNILAAAVIKRIVSNQPVNIGSGTRTSLLQLVDILVELTGWKLDVEHHRPRIGDVQHSQAEIRRLRELFGSVQLVDLRSGLASTLEWCQASADKQEFD